MPHRFIHPPEVIRFGMTQLSSIPQFIRSLILFILTLKLLKKSTLKSPMLDSYYINFKVTLFADCSIIAAFTIAFFLNRSGMKGFAYSIDPAFSFLIGIYMLLSGTKLIVSNFKSLVNLPLPEEDQMKIMQVLTKNYDRYDNIGNLYTNLSGKTRFIEMELYLPETASLDEITALQKKMEKDLQEHFSDICFKLIPLKTESDSSR